MRRLDEGGADALVQISEPVNRFPEFVGYLVRRLKTLCPAMGRVRIARVLARTGLHLGPKTVRRMLRAPKPPTPHRVPEPEARRITARKPDDLWHLDLATVPTALGLWASWVPFALPPTWPFRWWVSLARLHVVALQHHCLLPAASRRLRKQAFTPPIYRFIRGRISGRGTLASLPCWRSQMEQQKSMGTALASRP